MIKIWSSLLWRLATTGRYVLQTLGGLFLPAPTSIADTLQYLLRLQQVRINAEVANAAYFYVIFEPVYRRRIVLVPFSCGS
jgi:hypothetical protein